MLLEGPAGTGKTRALCEKGNALATNYPGSRGLFLRKFRASLTESVLPEFERGVLWNGHPALRGANMAHRQAYDYPNGSRIVLGGLDNPERLMSTQYDFVYIFEATETTEAEVEMVSTRLRNGVIPYQQLVCDCNPSGPNHWLNRRAQAGKMTRILTRHKDNPTYHDGTNWTKRGVDYMRKLDHLTGHGRARLLEGKWSQAEGLVYETFDAATHLIDQMPEGWERWAKFRSIDFGYTNPFVCQWWAQDGDGRLYLYREVYRTQRLVSVHARDIDRLSAGESYQFTVADHDAEGRATLDAEGLGTITANKEVERGIQAVQDRLRVREDGKPRIYFLRSALAERDELLVEKKAPCCTAEEFDSYVWQQTKEGKPIKEEPLKVNDHGMDAMRYMVMQLDNAIPFSISVITHGRSEPQPMDMSKARGEGERAHDAYRKAQAERMQAFLTGAPL